MSIIAQIQQLIVYIRQSAERIDSNLKRNSERIERLARYILGLTLLIQLVTAATLLIVTAIRDRHKKQRHFPTIDLDEVQVGTNRLLLYGYGRYLYEDMLAAIDKAKETIFIESYIWKGDEAGIRFKEHLARKAAEGVHVYVIFDYVANMVVPRQFKNSFDRHIHLLEFQQLRSLPHYFDLRRYALDHRKLLIVDGRIGFIGGYNIGSLYENSWRDSHLRIVGSEAAELARSFTDFWNRFCPRREQIEPRFLHRFNPLITLHENDALKMTFPIRDMYIEAINRAEHTIYLSNAYFVPDHILLEALGDAAQRGVDVRIMVPRTSNHVLADWVSHSYFEQCLKAGIHILAYKPAMLHAKTCTIDGQWSTVGTANMDRLSSIGNFEINLEIYSHDFAQQMERLFEKDSENSIVLTREMWKKRQWYTKLSERILAPLRFMV